MSDHDPTNPIRRTCVVWRPSGAAPSDALLRALSKRDLRVQTTDSRHEALAIACVAHRKREALVLVLDRAESLEQRARTLESIERFAPGALVWVFDEHANPPLRAFVAPTAPECGSEQRPSNTPTTTNRAGPPNLRLTGSDPDERISSADILDQDELDALLGTDEA